MIANASFTDGSSGNPNGWLRGGWGTNTPAYTYPVLGDSDSAAAKVEITSYTNGDAKWYFQEVPVTAGKTYVYRDRYQSTATSQLVAQIRSGSSYSYVFLSQQNSSGGAWSTATGEFTVPAGGEAVTVFHLIFSVGSLTIDNASLQEKPLTTFSEGMVSLDFDDGWLSIYNTAIPILNAAGFKSTQYIITGTMNTDPEYMTSAQVLSMASQGHEIGAHTRTHAHLPTLTASQLLSEVQGSKDDLNAIGLNPADFAYPYGEYNNTVVQAVSDAGFAGARSVDEGFNDRLTNKLLLKAYGMESGTSTASVKSLIDTALAQKTWLILFFHKVDNSGEQYSTTPAQLQEIVNYLQSKNVKVVTASQGRSLMQ